MRARPYKKKISARGRGGGAQENSAHRASKKKGGGAAGRRAQQVSERTSMSTRHPCMQDIATNRPFFCSPGPSLGITSCVVSGLSKKEPLRGGKGEGVRG